jgi:rod shape-determining protein MreC
MLKKSHYIILLIVVLAALALLKLPGETVGKFKLAVSGLFLPLFGLTASSHQLWNDAKGNLTPRGELLRENDQLRRLAQEQQIFLQQDTNLWLENQRLRTLLGFPSQTRWKLKLARVIARDPANWWRSMQIDLGARDGVRPDFPILTAEGLVGRVRSVGATRSQIIVLGDPSLEVSAKIDPSGEMGVISAVASSPQENGMVDLLRLSGTSKARPGQTVVSSGQGGIFPEGILIGTIVDTRSRDYGMSTEARVKLSVDLGTLDEVWVKFP